MALDDIQNLLRKYFDAKTTIEEENTLRQFFKQENIPSNLVKYKDMFSYFEQDKSAKYTKKVQIKSRKPNWKWLSIAASVVIVATLFMVHNNRQQKLANKKFKITQRALNIVSKNLNKGNRAVTQLNEFKKTTNKIFK